ncbi:carbohydrate ABC transporter permease [Streptomyces sp. NBC_01537]|uniref:carbohydrate ABC transporter permease n=1 Tax=Streptomyces sp. NBC_01537 TaxID=2903896 RepID=UPI00386D569B
MTRLRTHSTGRRLLGYTALIGFALLFLGPFAIQIATAFKTSPDATSHPLSLIPNPATMASWKRIFGYSDEQPVPFGTWLMNSIIVSTSITLLRVFLDSLAGYALARLRFPGRRLALGLVLSVLAVPPVVLLIPRFLVLQELDLYNSYAGMILPIAVDAMGILLMRGFFLQVPLSIEEAARIDGAGVFRTYWEVVLPLVKPGLITLTILSFQGSWNEFSFFLVATSDPKFNTLTTGLAKFSGSLGQGNQFPVTLGAALLSTIPVAILFLIFQRHLIRGQLAGGVKG